MIVGKFYTHLHIHFTHRDALFCDICRFSIIIFVANGIPQNGTSLSNFAWHTDSTPRLSCQRLLLKFFRQRAPKFFIGVSSKVLNLGCKSYAVGVYTFRRRGFNAPFFSRTRYFPHSCNQRSNIAKLAHHAPLSAAIGRQREVSAAPLLLRFLAVNRRDSVFCVHLHQGDNVLNPVLRSVCLSRAYDLLEIGKQQKLWIW